MRRPASPRPWPDALDALAEASGATGAVLLPGAAGSAEGDFFPRHLRAGRAACRGGLAPSNPRMRRGLELTAAGWLGLITDRDMFGEEGLPPGDYSAFLEQHGFGWVAGMVLARAGHDLIVPVSIERRLDQGPFTRRRY